MIEEKVCAIFCIILAVINILQNRKIEELKAKVYCYEHNLLPRGGHMIRVNDLIEWAKKHAIGRSVSYPDGWVDGIDLITLGEEVVQQAPFPYKPGGTHDNP